MKTYLVTGGAGFIGSNFILYMLRGHEDIRILNLDSLTYAGNLQNLVSVEKDPRYSFIRANVCDRERVLRIFQETSIDIVVHFAAESHVDRSIEDSEVFARTNVLGTLNLLDAVKTAWQEGAGYREGVKYVQVSTDEVYGALGAEGFFTEETPLDPHSPYSASKSAADLFVKAYADTFQLPTNITRCSNNYGPYQFPEKLIPLMIHNARNKKNLPVYGDGLQVRDWIYVDDHCRAIDLVIQGGKPGEVYNVGGHNERYNIDIVKKIIGLVSEKVDPTIDESLIRHVQDRKGHDRRYAIDPAKIRRELGWSPQIMFDEGIGKTVDWYLANQEWLQGVTSGDYKEYYEKMYKHRF